jgi:drug/metabolite transporter (DMT)-like permease
MFLFGNGGVVWGEQYVPSGLTAVLVGTSPFWMVGIDAMVTRGQQMFVRQWAGMWWDSWASFCWSGRISPPAAAPAAAFSSV